MGLLDQIANFGNALEEGFAPPLLRAELRARRQALVDKQKREQALGLLGNSLFPDIPSTVTPGDVQNNSGLNLNDAANRINNTQFSGGVDNSRQRQLFGLLSAVSPEAAAQVGLGLLLPQAEKERSEPADIRTLRAIGIDPLSPEGREIILNRMKSSGQDDALIKRVELQLKSMELTEKERERVEKEETKEQQRLGLKLGIEDDIRNALELAELNKELAPLVSRPGTSFGDILTQARADLNAIFGEDTDRAVSLRNTFNKKQANFLINSIPRIQGSRVLNSQFSVLQSATGGLGVDPETNNQIIADSLDALIDSAKISGIPVEEVTGGMSEAEIRKIIEELRSGLFGRKPLKDILD